MSSNAWSERFQTYFSQEVAQKAAHSLSDGAEIELHVDTEVFTFTKVDGKNQVIKTPSKDAQIVFIIPPAAAVEILSHSSDKIAEIGIGISKLIVSQDPTKRIQVRFRSGFFTLFSMGYLGVLKTGGSEMATFLASKGLSGVDAIKAILKKQK